VSQVGNSDAASADNKYCPYCLKHKNKHPEKRPENEDNIKKAVPKAPQKPNLKSKTSLRKANKLLKKILFTKALPAS